MTNAPKTSIAAQKDAARNAAYLVRKSAHSPGDHCGALLAELGSLRGAVISAYMPIRTEIDPRPAMHALSRHNRICVPVILGAGQPLAFHEWTPGCALKPGPFGAMVPVSAVPLVPTVVIAPLLAFDPRCFRLGYGGGFYDRTLEGLRARGPLLAYGFAYAAQAAPSIPLEPTDQALDAVITEASVIRPLP